MSAKAWILPGSMNEGEAGQTRGCVCQALEPGSWTQRSGSWILDSCAGSPHLSYRYQITAFCLVFEPALSA